MPFRKKDKAPLSYSGPSLAEVQSFSDAKVAKELLRLKIEPHSRPLTFFDDPDWEDTSKPPKVWTKSEVVAKERETDVLHARILRGQLFAGYISEWLHSLKDSSLWTIIEDFEKAKASASERRYTAQDKLRQRAGWAVYAIEANKQPSSAQEPSRAKAGASPKEAPMQ